MLRLVQYLNQFFGGVGGEEKANVPIEVRAGPVGPGRALEGRLGKQGTVVATLVGGDNYVAEQREAALATVRAALRGQRPDAVVAGPAFDAGRYGVACAEVCRVARELGVPALTAMHPDNPGVLVDREALIVPTGASAADMAAVIEKVAALALKLGRGEELGPAPVEGYLPRGIRRPGLREKPGRERALEMLKAKLSGLPYATELVVRPYEVVAPAPPLADPGGATLGLITTGGIVPKGNPDRLVRGGAEHWFRYSIEGLDRLSPDDWDCVHRGFHIEIVKEHPDYVLPLGVVRDLERAGAVGRVHPWFFSTSGVGTAVTHAKRMGAEMADELARAGVAGAILVATWGTCNRCGATVAKEIERRGIPVALISAMPSLPLNVGASRVVKGSRIEHVCGNPGLPPDKDHAVGLRIVQTALEALRSPVETPTLFDARVG